jgi:hypothetical protein
MRGALSKMVALMMIEPTELVLLLVAVLSLTAAWIAGIYLILRVLFGAFKRRPAVLAMPKYVLAKRPDPSGASPDTCSALSKPVEQGPD